MIKPLWYYSIPEAIEMHYMNIRNMFILIFVFGSGSYALDSDTNRNIHNENNKMTNQQNNCLKIAAIQMLPAIGDPQANIQRATDLARKAVEDHKAELIVFPETTLTGYANPGNTKKTLSEIRKQTETVPGPSVDHFANLAGELGIYIVWGLHEKRGDKYYNSAVLLSPKGKVLGTYSKVHINKFEKEMRWTNGDKFHVWPCEINGTKFNLGIMICYDREVPEAARCLTVMGADIIVIPQATACTYHLPIHRDQLCVRAYENEVYIAMANWAGPKFKGHSMIIEPTGKVVKLGSCEEEILIAQLDMDQLKKHRENGIYGRHYRQPNAYRPLLRD